jgi:hypothetical protein
MEPQFRLPRNCRRDARCGIVQRPGRELGLEVIMMQRAALAAFVAAFAMPATALAVTSQAKQVMQTWASSNRCAQTAQRAFPDFTPEANAKRDALMKRCLAGSNLPPRQSLENSAK